MVKNGTREMLSNTNKGNKAIIKRCTNLMVQYNSGKVHFLFTLGVVVLKQTYTCTKLTAMVKYYGFGTEILIHEQVIILQKTLRKLVTFTKTPNYYKNP